jgi:hypothetical protein
MYYLDFYINQASRPPYVRSVLYVSLLNYEFSMNDKYCVSYSSQYQTIYEDQSRISVY